MPLAGQRPAQRQPGLTSNYKYRGQDQDTSKTLSESPHAQGSWRLYW